MKFTPKQPTSNVNVTPTSPVKEFFVLAGGLLAIAIGLYLILGFAVDLIVPHLSIDFEKKLATPFVRHFASESKTSDQSRYVEGLVGNLKKNCAELPYDFKIHMVDSPAINAAAFPGGHIVVFKGLLDKMDSENELAFVLSHELGHYANRDHLRGLGRGLVLMSLSAFLLGPDSDISDMLIKGLNITELSFSRMQETRADEFALNTLNCYYGNVSGATDFFSKIPKENDPGKYGHYFASHPENRRRIAHLDDMTREKGFQKTDKIPLPEFMAKKPDPKKQ